MDNGLTDVGFDSVLLGNFVEFDERSVAIRFENVVEPLLGHFDAANEGRGQKILPEIGGE